MRTSISLLAICYSFYVFINICCQIHSRLLHVEGGYVSEHIRLPDAAALSETRFALHSARRYESEDEATIGAVILVQSVAILKACSTVATSLAWL